MGIQIVITLWQEITIQSLYCDLDMGTNTVMYYKCSHVPNLVGGGGGGGCTLSTLSKSDECSPSFRFI